MYFYFLIFKNPFDGIKTMGIRSRVKKTLQKIRVLARVIHDESKYPGRPQPHVAAQNPLWGGGDTRTDTESKDTEQDSSTVQKTPVPPTEQDTSVSSPQEENNNQGSLNEEGADYWFLQYEDVEGWNESNPGQKKADKKKVDKKKADKNTSSNKE